MRRLVLLALGAPGSGKSWLINTAPGPRLILDAEGRTEYLADLRADPSGMTPQRLVEWDPRDEIPEESSNPDVVTVVTVRTMEDMTLAYNWLSYKDHPWRSVGIDSLQEVQERMIEEISGVDKMEWDHFGEILRRMSAMIRAYCDLRKHPKHPLDALVVVVGSKEGDDGMKSPMLTGQIRQKAPFKFDVIGYMAKGMAPSDDGPVKVRYMVIDSYDPKVLGKDNTHALSHHYGERIFNPDISEMLSVLNPAQEATDE